MITADLRALQTEEEEGLAHARRVKQPGEKNIWMQIASPPPPGISETEWFGAMGCDRALGRVSQSIRDAQAAGVRVRLEQETGKVLYFN